MRARIRGIVCHTFCGLIADGRGVGGVSLGGVQGRRHVGVTVLVMVLWAGQALIVPGLSAVALAVHGAGDSLLVGRRAPLARRAGGPPRFLGRGRLLRLGGAQQAGHGQHPLNGFFRAG